MGMPAELDVVAKPRRVFRSCGDVGKEDGDCIRSNTLAGFNQVVSSEIDRIINAA